MNFNLPETFDILERTPAVVGTLLRGTSGSWHASNEGPGTWSAFDVVGHLIHGEETDWVPRARIILEHGEGRPFEPFDRFAQLNRFAGWSLENLLDRFAELRRGNLEIVRNWHLTEAQLALPGRHPELGPVRLRQLLELGGSRSQPHCPDRPRPGQAVYRRRRRLAGIPLDPQPVISAS